MPPISISLNSGSEILSQLNDNGEGTAGDIDITTNELTITSSVLRSSSSNKGDAGNVTITADTVSMDGTEDAL